MLFHSPLGLRERCVFPDARADFWPLASVLLVAFLLSLAGSRFVFAPGFLTSLESDAPAQLELPANAGGALAGVETTATLVVTTRGDMAFFDGRRYRLGGDDLRFAMRDAVGRNERQARESVLLLKADKSLSLERLMLLSDAARAAGFKRVLFAAQTGTVPPAASPAASAASPVLSAER